MNVGCRQESGPGSVEPKGVGPSGNPAASLMRCVPKLHIRIMVCHKGIHSARVPIFGNPKDGRVSVAMRKSDLYGCHGIDAWQLRLSAASQVDVVPFGVSGVDLARSADLAVALVVPGAGLFQPLSDGSFVRISDAHLDVPLSWQCWTVESPMVNAITEAVRSAAADLHRHRR